MWLTLPSPDSWEETSDQEESVNEEASGYEDEEDGAERRTSGREKSAEKEEEEANFGRRRPQKKRPREKGRRERRNFPARWWPGRPPLAPTATAKARRLVGVHFALVIYRIVAWSARRTREGKHEEAGIEL